MSELSKSISNATRGLDRYKSTNYYHSLIKSGKMPPSQKHEDLLKMKGHKPIKNTWDVTHLDKFLDNSEYASTTRIVRSSSQVPSQIDRNSTRAFKPGSRFPPDREISYLFNLMKDFSVKDPRLDVNSMVLLKEPDDIKAKEHFVAKFSTPEKRYNRSLLEYNDQPSTFSSPDLTKKQHDEVKENQVKLKEYREKFFEVNRRNRIYQSNYRSGILGIDNPALEQTQVYRERKEKLDRIQAEREKIALKRLDQIKNIHITSGVIEFHNPNYDPLTRIPPTQMAELNRKRFVNLEYVEDKKDSYKRIFQGVDPYHARYSVPRAEFLLRKESLGKDFNLVTGAQKVIPIKKIAPETDLDQRKTGVQCYFIN